MGLLASWGGAWEGHKAEMDIILAPLGGSRLGGGCIFCDSSQKKLKGHSGKVQTPKIL